MESQPKGELSEQERQQRIEELLECRANALSSYNMLQRMDGALEAEEIELEKGLTLIERELDELGYPPELNPDLTE